MILYGAATEKKFAEYSLKIISLLVARRSVEDHKTLVFLKISIYYAYLANRFDEYFLEILITVLWNFTLEIVQRFVEDWCLLFGRWNFRCTFLREYFLYYNILWC